MRPIATSVVDKGARDAPRSAALPEIVAVSKNVSRGAAVFAAVIGVLVPGAWVLEVEV